MKVKQMEDSARVSDSEARDELERIGRELGAAKQRYRERAALLAPEHLRQVENATGKTGYTYRCDHCCWVGREGYVHECPRSDGRQVCRVRHDDDVIVEKMNRDAAKLRAEDPYWQGLSSPYKPTSSCDGIVDVPPGRWPYGTIISPHSVYLPAGEFRFSSVIRVETWVDVWGKPNQKTMVHMKEGQAVKDLFVGEDIGVHEIFFKWDGAEHGTDTETTSSLSKPSSSCDCGSPFGDHVPGGSIHCRRPV